jgi:hypothetical protein
MMEETLRVSVAILNRVLFPNPRNGISMLALERKAVGLKDGSTRTWAQPFGGAVRIVDGAPLESLIGPIRFDSERSKLESDFRILIDPTQWEALKAYCCRALADPENHELESSPHRELAEEFEEALGMELQEDQYTSRPSGFVIEDRPTPTGNSRARGLPTVRLYRIFEVQIVDQALCETMLASSERYTEEELEALAQQHLQNGERGSAHSVLALPLQAITDAWLAYPPDLRYRNIRVDDHELDESVLAVLEDIQVSQYERVYIHLHGNT